MVMKLRSRWGNLALAVAGALYAAAGGFLLYVALTQTWSIASLRDIATYLVLAAIALGGTWFVVLATHGLAGLGRTHARRQHATHAR